MTDSNTMELRGRLFEREHVVVLSRVAGRPGERRQWSSPNKDFFVTHFPSNKAPLYFVFLELPETEDPASLRGEGSTFQEALDDLAKRVEGVHEWAEALKRTP